MAQSKEDEVQTTIIGIFFVLFFIFMIFIVWKMDSAEHDRDASIQSRYDLAFATPDSLGKIQKYIAIYDEIRMLPDHRGSIFFRSDLRYDVSIASMLDRLIEAGDEITIDALLDGRINTYLDGVNDKNRARAYSKMKYNKAWVDAPARLIHLAMAKKDGLYGESVNIQEALRLAMEAQKIGHAEHLVRDIYLDIDDIDSADRWNLLSLCGKLEFNDVSTSKREQAQAWANKMLASNKTNKPRSCNHY